MTNFVPGSLGTTIRCLGIHGDELDFTYSDLSRFTNRFANVLKDLGVEKGERVFVLAGRVPELYIAAIRTLKNRNVFCPLFSAFGPEPIRTRATIGEAKVLVTRAATLRKQIAFKRT